MVTTSTFSFLYLKHFFHDSTQWLYQQDKNISYLLLHNELDQNLVAKKNKHLVAVISSVNWKRTHCQALVWLLAGLRPLPPMLSTGLPYDMAVTFLHSETSK